MEQKPNIVVILTDQQNSKMLSCAGSPWVHTPFLDQLAGEGVRFTNVCCSNPVCIASRFSLMTGCYPSAAGFKSNDYKREMTRPVPDSLLQQGIGWQLQSQGYQVFYGGKEHLPGFKAEDLGFRYFCKDEREGLAKSSAELIQKMDTSRPFCMVASFINPHDICLMAMRDHAMDADNEFDQFLVGICRQPREEVEKAEAMAKEWPEETFYAQICPPLPENFEVAADEPEAIQMLQAQRGFKKLARERYSEMQWRMHRWVYAKLTEQVDSQIGLLLQSLRQKGIWDQTVIIFTSDHGDMDASHRMEHKTALYQESVYVPLIIKDCQGHRGVCGSLISNGLDLIPTIRDYAGLEPGGASIRRCMEDQQAVLHQQVLVESEFGRMVAMQDCCYQLYDAGRNREQFFDRRTNPGQMFNQIDDPAFQQKIQEARAFLHCQSGGLYA